MELTLRAHQAHFLIKCPPHRIYLSALLWCHAMFFQIFITVHSKLSLKALLDRVKHFAHEYFLGDDLSLFRSTTGETECHRSSAISVVRIHHANLQTSPALCFIWNVVSHWEVLLGHWANSLSQPLDLIILALIANLSLNLSFKSMDIFYI